MMSTPPYPSEGGPTHSNRYAALDGAAIEAWPIDPVAYLPPSEAGPIAS
ncbi:MAG: hypothetical protein ACE5NA_03080 [Nitrospiraceae bacterium]